MDGRCIYKYLQLRLNYKIKKYINLQKYNGSQKKTHYIKKLIKIQANIFIKRHHITIDVGIKNMNKYGLRGYELCFSCQVGL